MTSLAGLALPGNRKRGFITADTESFTCSTSSRLTKDAMSIFWKALLPSQNPKFAENPAELGPHSSQVRFASIITYFMYINFRIPNKHRLAAQVKQILQRIRCAATIWIQRRLQPRMRKWSRALAIFRSMRNKCNNLIKSKAEYAYRKKRKPHIPLLSIGIVLRHLRGSK